MSPFLTLTFHLKLFCIPLRVLKLANDLQTSVFVSRRVLSKYFNLYKSQNFIQCEI
jgi:hypothetical protein